DNDDEVWCFYREPAHGKMIQCDNDDCLIQWYHFSCVGLKKAPKGDWYCEECQN
ncbi:the Ing1 Phd finger in complex with A histone H3k4me3 peptide, partial [Phascolomyces articulosus]